MRAEVYRRTKETEVRLTLSLEGGEVSSETGVPMLDHMVRTLAYYAGWGLVLRASGDLQHHVVEDCGIAVGEALSRALEERDGMARFGSAVVPMDGSLVIAAVDLARRAYYASNLPEQDVEGLSGSLLSHFLRSLAFNAQITLSLHALSCDMPHHCFEAAFKALGLAMKQATAPIGSGPLSTKGSL